MTPEQAEPRAVPKEPNAFVSTVEGIGKSLIGMVTDLGGLATLGFQVARWSFRRPFRTQNFFAQLDFVGVGSIFIVALTGLFTGMVFAQQSSRAPQGPRQRALCGRSSRRRSRRRARAPRARRRSGARMP